MVLAVVDMVEDPVSRVFDSNVNLLAVTLLVAVDDDLSMGESISLTKTCSHSCCIDLPEYRLRWNC